MADEQQQYIAPPDQQPIQSTQATPGASPIFLSELPGTPDRFAFFKKPVGKIILFTGLFLGVAALIMYSSNLVGLKGSMIDTGTGVGDSVAVNADNGVVATPAAGDQAAAQTPPADAPATPAPAGAISVPASAPAQPENIAPNAPKWQTPSPSAELAITDLSKTEFTWTDGGDSDNGPAKKPNYQFAIIKGEITDQKELTAAFSSLDAELTKKYDFAWTARWTDKKTLDQIQTLMGSQQCVEDMGNSTFIYTCTKFKIPQDAISQMKEGQKYTFIVQAGDGATGSPYATNVIAIKKAEDCPLNQYYVTDSQNSGCKKVPNFIGAFSQTGFICSIYKTVATNPDNSYRLSADTKTALQKNIDTDCSKKPDATNICQTKMTYLASGKTLCEPFKSIVDQAQTKDVCAQYTSQEANTSLSLDTKKQIDAYLGAQCKPKLCPSGKYLDGQSVPDDCKSVPIISSITSPYDQGKACDAMKKIIADTGALDTFKIDQSTLDQIKLVSQSDICNPKAKSSVPSADALPPSLSSAPIVPVVPAANIKSDSKVDASILPAKSDTVASSTTCPAGQYLAGTSLASDCKALPDLFTLQSVPEITNACALFKQLASGALNGKMDIATSAQVKISADNVLCHDVTTTPAKSSTAASTNTSPPSLSMTTPATGTPDINANALSGVSSSASSKIASSTKTSSFEPLPYGQSANLQPKLPVAGTYIPRSTANTGPEMWIYAYGALAGLIGSRKFKRANKKINLKK